MSPSSTSRPATYGALPLPPGTSLSWMPPSSLYCCHRSLSMISIAARNLRMATSPCVRRALPSWAKAGNPLANSPVPMAPAPTTASPLRKKERRPVEYLDCCVLCFMILSFLRLLRVVSHYLLLIVVESIAATSQHLEMWVRWQSLNKCTKHAILHLVCSTLSREEC